MNNNNYLICCLMVLILILFIVDICKKKKNKESFDSIHIETVKDYVEKLNTEMDNHSNNQKSRGLKNYTYLLTLQSHAKYSLKQMIDSENRISALETDIKNLNTDSIDQNKISALNTINALDKRISDLETKFNSDNDLDEKISSLEKKFNSHKGGTAINEHSTI